MAFNSGIEWTTHTFNPWWGCVEVSPLCDHCYARDLDARYYPKETHWGVNARRKFQSDKYWSEPLRWNKAAAAAGERHRVFCASMADWAERLHVDHPDYLRMLTERARLFDLIERTPNLDWLLLTKRIGNVQHMVPDSWMDGHWPRNAWVGTSIGTQEAAVRDTPKLCALPAPVRFLSMEPLLEKVTLTRGVPAGGDRGYLFQPLYVKDSIDGVDYRHIDWVITGGESGPNARPSHPDWFRSLRDECVEAGVPYFFKQWGEYVSGYDLKLSREDIFNVPGHIFDNSDGSKTCVYRVGKKAAGRVLDGKVWDQIPEVAS